MSVSSPLPCFTLPLPLLLPFYLHSNSTMNPSSKDGKFLLASTFLLLLFIYLSSRSLQLMKYPFLFYHFLVRQMDASMPKCAIQLKEHLQHQQEPFSLQDYFVERSYMFKNCNFDSRNIHHLYSAKNLKWSIKYDLPKKRKRILQATEFLKTLLYKFIPTVDNKEFSYYVHEITADTQATGPTNELFSLKRLAASDHITNNDVGNNVLLYEQHHSSTLVDTFQSFTLPKLERSEVDIGSKPYWIRSKENKQQYSKGSEWKEEPLPDAVCLVKSPEASAIPVPVLSQKLVRDPLFSTYLRKLLVNSNILKFGRAKKDKMQEIAGTASLCQRNRRILQKREQLPFGCVEKDREFHENEGKSVSMKAVLESEDLQCIIQEHLSLLEKQCTQVKKITHLLHTESSVTVTSQEWDNFQIVNREIRREIGDAIMDDMVREIIDLF